MTKEDLDLIDALVWAGCLSRAAAREVARGAPDGKVATYIMERGLAPLISPPHVILAALLKAETEVRLEPVEDDWAAARARKRSARPLSDDALVRGMSCAGCEAYWPVGELGDARLRISSATGEVVGSCAKCDEQPETD